MLLSPFLHFAVFLAVAGLVLWPLSEGLGFLFRLPKAKVPEPARPCYIFEQAWHDTWATVLRCLSLNAVKTRSLKDTAENWWSGNWGKKIAALGPIWGIISLWTFGLAIILAFTAPFLAVVVVSLLAAYDMCLAVRLWERGRMFWHGLHAFCPHADCGHRIYLPVYRCSCGREHWRLIPDKHGVWKHGCECGRNLPTTFSGRNRLAGQDRLSASCPGCERPLLADAGQEVSFAIGLIGAPGSGKTTYMAALARRMAGRPSPLWGDRSVSVPDAGEKTKIEETLQAMDEGSPTRKTREDELEACKFDCQPSDGRPVRRINVFDMSGETFRTSANMDRSHYFRLLTGLVILADLPSLTASAARDLPFKSVVERLLERLGRVPDIPRRRGKFSIPCAVVLSKSEEGPDSGRLLGPLVGAAADPQAPGTTDEAIDRRCRSFLEKQQGLADVVGLVETHFTDHCFFAASAKGLVPDATADIGATCGCGATFMLKGEKAGKTRTCGQCQRSFKVPAKYPICVERPLLWILERQRRWA